MAPLQVVDDAPFEGAAGAALRAVRRAALADPDRATRARL